MKKIAAAFLLASTTGMTGCSTLPTREVPSTAAMTPIEDGMTTDIDNQKPEPCKEGVSMTWRGPVITICPKFF